MSPNIFKRSHFLIFTRNTPNRPCPSAHFHLSHVREKQCVCSYYNYLRCMYIITQSYLTLCDPTDCSPPGSSVHGILQTIILEWIAIPFFKGSSWPRDWTRGSKESACNAWDLSLNPGLGRSPGEGNHYSLQYSCLENSMDRGAWRIPWTEEPGGLQLFTAWQRVRHNWATNTLYINRSVCGIWNQKPWFCHFLASWLWVRSYALACSIK